ncbi:MAG: DUF433 domain-containing protein [Bacteroidetes bacterium]|nr:DUF433 domain-containing protein [Bacteroidota bacterium]MCB0843481.1 DUF433 domain-containing protein [Bacteroidota bacterium]MCB0854203.1 DUF433 domain-containing protein [Bacteroidota bacterium]
MINYQEYISIDPEIRFGRPCLIGTRISVYDVLGWLAAGMSIQEIIDDFPQLNQSQIMACLAYASERERRVKVAA